MAVEALAVNADRSNTKALEAIVTKAGEVMRERCNNAFGEKHGWYADATFNAIPGVKLEDLK